MSLTWNLYDKILQGSHLDSYASTNVLTLQILVRNKKNVILKTKFFSSRENIVDGLHYAIVLAGNLTEGENRESHGLFLVPTKFYAHYYERFGRIEDFGSGRNN